MIKTYSAKKDGKTQLSANFTVGEFQCNDKSDKVLVDLNLVNILQKVRNEYGVIKGTSYYRSPKYNKKVGGVADSTHLWGKAIDLTKLGNKSIKQIYTILKNAGLYTINEGTWVHADTRYIAPNSTFPILKKGSSGEWVYYLQHLLSRKGYKCTKDGLFGKITKSLVIAFQKNNGLVQDGIVGNKTWNKLK